jgi:hypothetical protein
MLLLVAKIMLIRAKVTGMPETINEVVGQEVKGVKIEVKVAKVEAIKAKTNYIRTLKSKKIILRISY